MMRRHSGTPQAQYSRAARLRPLATAIAAALLTACAPLPRAVPDNAQLQLPAQWSVPTDTAANVQNTTLIPTDWWTQLGDAQLNTLVAQALVDNTDVLTALARVQEAQANLTVTDAARSPNINATLGAQAGRSLGAFGPTHTRSVQPRKSVV